MARRNRMETLLHRDVEGALTPREFRAMQAEWPGYAAANPDAVAAWARIPAVEVCARVPCVLPVDALCFRVSGDQWTPCAVDAELVADAAGPAAVCTPPVGGGGSGCVEPGSGGAGVPLVIHGPQGVIAERCLLASSYVAVGDTAPTRQILPGCPGPCSVACVPHLVVQQPVGGDGCRLVVRVPLASLRVTKPEGTPYHAWLLAQRSNAE